MKECLNKDMSVVFISYKNSASFKIVHIRQNARLVIRSTDGGHNKAHRLKPKSGYSLF